MKITTLIHGAAVCVLVSSLTVLTLGTAHATTESTIVATERTSVVASGASAQPAVQANIINGLTIRTKPRTTLTVSAKHQKTQRTTTDGAGRAVIRGLTPGVRYTVSAHGKVLQRVTPVSQVTPVTDLLVLTTDQRDAVRVEWKHRNSRATGGSMIQYLVEASSATAPTTRVEVTGQTQALLTNLDPHAIYRFTVTSRNTASTAKPSQAVMTRSLQDIRGESDDPQENAPHIRPQPVVQPATPGPAPAPGPTTRTVWVCPEGSVERDASTCQFTQAYTYTTKQTGTRTIEHPATYQDNVVEVRSDTNCPAGSTPSPRSPGVVWCITQSMVTPPWTETIPVYGEVKDATPAGFIDDGSQWIRIVGKIERVIPA